MVGEELRVLVEEAVVRVGIDPQVRFGQPVGEEPAVLGVHHRVVVADGDEGGLRDAGEPVELRRLGNSPGSDRGELGVSAGEVGRCVAIVLACVRASEVLTSLRLTLG